jgi:hypothetical protein
MYDMKQNKLPSNVCDNRVFNKICFSQENKIVFLNFFLSPFSLLSQSVFGALIENHRTTPGQLSWGFL